MIETINKYKSYYPTLLLLAAFVIRLLFLFFHDAGLNQDELSNMYDAWSISETGTDRWNSELFWELRAFGEPDHRPALISYFLSIVFFFTGPSAFIARFTCLLIGIIGLFFLHKFTLNISSNRTFQFFTLLIATLSPWHISYTPLAIESAVLYPTLVIICLYLWSHLIQSFQKKHLLLLSICLILLAFSYQAAKLSAPLLTVLILAHLFYLKKYKYMMWIGIICLMGTSPYLCELIYYPHYFFARANSVPNNYSGILLYDVIYFIDNLAKAINPNFLFFEINNTNNLSPFRGLITESIFFYIGLFSIKQSVIKHKWFLVTSVIIFISPCVFTDEIPHSFRQSGLMYLIPLFSALGITLFIDYLKYKKYIITYCTIALLVISFSVQANFYYQSEELREGFQISNTRIYSQLDINKNMNYYMVDHGNQPYIYLSFLGKLSPIEFKSAVIEMHSDVKKIKWDHIKRIDNYHWLNNQDIQSLLDQNQPGIYIFNSDSIAQQYKTDSILFSGKHTFYYKEIN